MLDSYRSDPRLNFSKLKHIAKSPAHFVAACEADDEQTPAMRIGELTHRAILEPVRYHETVVVFPGRRAGKEWERFESEHASKDIVTVAESDLITQMAAAAFANKRVNAMLSGAKVELEFYWRDAETGIDLKGRIDGLAADGTLFDVKTCVDASPKEFARDAFNRHYAAQLAMYHDAILATGGVVSQVAFIAIEKSPPFVVQEYLVPDWLLDEGRATYRGWLALYQKCEAENRWPAYADGPLMLSLPSWAMRDDETDLSELGLK